MTKSIYLTDQEQEMLELLAQGISYRNAAARCYVAPNTLSTFMANLRRKTGIEDTKRPESVQRYLDLTKQKPSTTEDHVRILEYRANGLHLEAVAHKMGTSFGSISAKYDEALRCAGIYATDERARSVQIKQFVASRKEQNAYFNDSDLALLKRVAKGQSVAQIADELRRDYEYIKEQIRGACRRAGIMVSRGRNVQQTLIRSWMAGRYNLEKQESVDGEEISPEITMDDPMF